MVVLPAALAARVRELTRSSERPRRGRAFRRQLSELLGRQRHARRCGWQPCKRLSAAPQLALQKAGRQWGSTCRGAALQMQMAAEGLSDVAPCILEGTADGLESLTEAADVSVGALSLHEFDVHVLW